MKYTITAKMDTYATCEVEADSADEAVAKADRDEDVHWTYDTDFDSSTITEVKASISTSSMPSSSMPYEPAGDSMLVD